MNFKPYPKHGAKPKKTPKPLKRTSIKKKFKATGEKCVFEEVLDEVPYDSVTKCFVCDVNIALVTHSNFAHVINKKKYTDYKLYPKNIKILCHRIIAGVNEKTGLPTNGCHSDWDTKPRSELKHEMWNKMKSLETELIKQYPITL